MKRLRFKQPRGYRGTIIARNAVVDIDDVWAERFVADGTAVEEAKTSKAAKPEKEKAGGKAKNGKGKG